MTMARGRTARSRAQSIVEFALVIPILLGLFLALVDAARFLAIYVGLANGVTSGARVASIPSNSTTAVQNAVVQSIILADTTAIRGSVVITPAIRVAQNPVTVQASSAFTWNPVIAAVLGTAGLGTVTIVQRATATVEGP
jgi:Flp pilus assembly protein TadG